jgi:hypothetical protein
MAAVDDQRPRRHEERPRSATDPPPCGHDHTSRVRTGSLDPAHVRARF